MRRVLAAHPEFEFSVSATTRPIRGTEVHGKDYFYLTVEDFRARIAAGDFLEWQEVYPGRYYGSLKSEVDRILSSGRSVLFDVDVKGGVNIKHHYGARALSLFIRPPSLDVLRLRLVTRATESMEEINRRLDKAGAEMGFADQFDKEIINDDLESAVKEVETVIQKFMQHD